MRGQSAIPARIFEMNSDTRTESIHRSLLSSTDISYKEALFSERVVDRWNRLDQQCVDVLTVNASETLGWSFFRALSEGPRSKDETRVGGEGGGDSDRSE